MSTPPPSLAACITSKWTDTGGLRVWPVDKASSNIFVISGSSLQGSTDLLCAESVPSRAHLLGSETLKPVHLPLKTVLPSCLDFHCPDLACRRNKWCRGRWGSALSQNGYGFSA
eukprot:6429488-Amphidinium_carterae.1